MTDLDKKLAENLRKLKGLDRTTRDLVAQHLINKYLEKHDDATKALVAEVTKLKTERNRLKERIASEKLRMPDLPLSANPLMYRVKLVARKFEAPNSKLHRRNERGVLRTSGSTWVWEPDHGETEMLYSAHDQGYWLVQMRRRLHTIIFERRSLPLDHGPIQHSIRIFHITGIRPLQGPMMFPEDWIIK